jgi:hypothetical protein
MARTPAAGNFRRRLTSLAQEPPIRLVVRALVRALPTSVRTKAEWDATVRPHYLFGILFAADEARREGIDAICVAEFGVAAGDGLVILERHAAAVEEETGVHISVYGFDRGVGLPELCGDHRDHPDCWRPSDFPMDEAALRARLSPRTQLVLGDVRETVPDFVRQVQSVPLGFAAFDLDLYSSTTAALGVLSSAGRKVLRRTMLYFDDIESPLGFTHRFAGELLAIDEFNASTKTVKIDRYRGLTGGRPFAEEPYLGQLYVAHDLEAISSVRLDRPAADMTAWRETAAQRP